MFEELTGFTFHVAGKVFSEEYLQCSVMESLKHSSWYYVTILGLEQLLHSSFSAMPLLLRFSILSSIFFESNLYPSVNLQPHIKKIHLLNVNQAFWTPLFSNHAHTALWGLYNVSYELENKLQLFYDIQIDTCESACVLPQHKYLD